MRTDAKVGLICALVLGGGVVAYYVLPSHKKAEVVEYSPTPVLSNDPTPADKSAPGSLLIAPPTAPTTPTASLTGPAAAFGDDVPATAPGSSLPPGFTVPSSTTTPAPTVKIESPTAATATSPTDLTTTPVTAPHKPNIDPMTATSLPPSNTPTSSFPEMPGLTGGAPTSTLNTTGATTYTIKAGDIYPKIAKATYGNAKYATIKAIEDANPGVDPTKLKVGQKINLPASIPGSTASGTTSTIDTTGTTSTTTTTTKPAKTKSPAGTYTVKTGDTLRKIAKSTLGSESKWKTLAKVNNITDPDTIYVGEVLKIPAK